MIEYNLSEIRKEKRREVTREDIRQALNNKKIRLLPREVIILYHRYGLSNSGCALSLDEVANLLHSSRRTIRKFEVSAMRKIRPFL